MIFFRQHKTREELTTTKLGHFVPLSLELEL